jgi:hypothetical protein
MTVTPDLNLHEDQARRAERQSWEFRRREAHALADGLAGEHKRAAAPLNLPPWAPIPDLIDARARLDEAVARSRDAEQAETRARADLEAAEERDAQAAATARDAGKVDPKATTGKAAAAVDAAVRESRIERARLQRRQGEYADAEHHALDPLLSRCADRWAEGQQRAADLARQASDLHREMTEVAVVAEAVGVRLAQVAEPTLVVDADPWPEDVLVGRRLAGRKVADVLRGVEHRTGDVLNGFNVSGLIGLASHTPERFLINAEADPRRPGATRTGDKTSDP